MIRLLIAFGLICAAAPAVAQDASGEWRVTVTTEQRGTETTSMALKKDGDKLSGTIVGPRDSILTVAGTQTGADVVLSFAVPTEDGPVPVTMEGRQDGESMKGTLKAGTDMVGDWTASRPGAVPAGTVDLTGTWALEVVTDAGTRTPTATLKQQGENLRGEYKSQLGEAQIAGRIKGSDFSFVVTLPIEGTSTTIVYSGTAETDAMKGKVTVGDVEVGTFSGKKAAPR
jgi:hypothetical protein